MTSLKKLHRYLVAGEIVFTIKDDDGNDLINTVRLNSVLAVEHRNIIVKDIGRAQQALQMNLHRRLEGDEVVVRDVVIMNISYLGYCTEKEFQAPPKGVAVMEADSSATDKLPLIN